MHEPTSSNVAVSRLALSGVAAVIVLNLLLRSLVHLGGVLTTLLIAGAVAAGMAAWFRWQHGRKPLARERLRLLGIYAGVLALLYLGLLGLMLHKDGPGPVGLLLFAAHYFCYPLLAWLLLAPQPRAKP